MTDRRTHFELRDATGALVAVHIRIDDEMGKRFLWAGEGGKRGLGGLAMSALPLFGIERLEASRVVVTEGEKAATALLDAGVPAVGTVCGASSTPGPTALADLTGRHVVLWPDNDDVGRDHMRRVAEALRGIAASVAVLSWPEAPEHGDAADFLADQPVASVWELIEAAAAPGEGYRFVRAGLGYVATFPDLGLVVTFDHVSMARGALTGELTVTHLGEHIHKTRFNATAGQTRKTVARTLAERAPTVKVDWFDLLERFSVRVLAAEREGEPIVLIGRDPRRATTPYLVYPMLQEGQPTILYGEGKTGKSFLAGAIAVSLETGHSVLDAWDIREPVRCLILDWEASAEDWNDRIAMIAKGRDLEAPHVAYRHCSTSLPEQVEEVARYVAEHEIALVVIDSVGLAMPGAKEGVDSNDGALRLFRAVRELRTTVLLIDHVSKAETEKTSGSARPYGSIYKINLARSLFELRRDESDDPAFAHIALYHRWSNNTSTAPPLGIVVEYGEDIVTFKPEGMVDRLIQRGETQLDQIERALAPGPMSPREIADATGISGNQVRPLLARGVKRGHLTKLPGERYGLPYHQEELSA